MAPKKKQQKPKASSSSSSTGPKLQLSAENEDRLRRLLLNSGRSAPSQTPPQNPLSKEQKAKRLRSVYEKLSCDGFKDDQIELALSALMVRNLLVYSFNWPNTWMKFGAAAKHNCIFYKRPKCVGTYCLHLRLLLVWFYLLGECNIWVFSRLAMLKYSREWAPTEVF